MSLQMEEFAPILAICSPLIWTPEKSDKESDWDVDIEDAGNYARAPV